jgi:hypothetical protein
MARTQRFTRCAALALGFVAWAQLASAQSKPMSATLDDNRDLNLRAYVELLRSDLRTQKVALISEVMEFTEAEDAKFWPIYRDYEAQLVAINDERIAMIKEFASSFDTLTDSVADRLAKKAIELQARRDALEASMYERVKGALSVKTAARYLQVEHQILLLLDLQIASSLPVVSR